MNTQLASADIANARVMAKRNMAGAIVTCSLNGAPVREYYVIDLLAEMLGDRGSAHFLLKCVTDQYDAEMAVHYAAAFAPIPLKKPTWWECRKKGFAQGALWGFAAIGLINVLNVIVERFF